MTGIAQSKWKREKEGEWEVGGREKERGREDSPWIWERECNRMRLTLARRIKAIFHNLAKPSNGQYQWILFLFSVCLLSSSHSPLPVSSSSILIHTASYSFLSQPRDTIHFLSFSSFFSFLFLTLIHFY